MNPPTSVAEKKKLTLFDTAVHHADIWRDAHDFLTKNIGSGYLIGDVHRRIFELSGILNRLENFIADTERDKHHSTSTYNTVLTYLYFLAGTLHYQMAEICLHHGGSSQEMESRIAAAIQRAIEHFTAALTYETATPMWRMSSPNQQRYGRLVCMIALADLHAMATKCRVWLCRQEQPFFSGDSYQRFCWYAEQALAETERYDHGEDIEARLRVCALGLFQLGLTPDKKKIARDEIGTLVHSIGRPEGKIRRLLGKEFAEDRMFFLWGLKLSFYQDTERPIRDVAETKGGGWFFLMPEVPAPDYAIARTHRSILRKGWTAANERWPNQPQESWRHYVSNNWLFEKLYLRADALQAPTLRLYAVILNSFYHFVSVLRDRSFDQTYWAQEALKGAIDAIENAILSGEAKRILRINLTALQAANLVERVGLLCEATYEFKNKNTQNRRLYTPASRRADTKFFLEAARELVKSVSPADIKSLPLHQRWFFHEAAADLYARMPQTGVIKRAAIHHRRLATRGRNAAIGKTSTGKTVGDRIVDDVLEFLLQGASE